MKRRGIDALVMVGLAVELAACGLASEPRPEPYSNVCTSDASCRVGTRCEPSLGICVSSTDPGYSIELDVLLSAGGAGTSATALSFQDIEVRTLPLPVELDVPSPVAATGTVRVLDGTGGESAIAANVTFTAVAGRARVGWSASTRASASAEFATQLVPETTYAVLVEPVDAARAMLPPLRATLEVRANGVSVPIDYDTSSLRAIEGSLVDAMGQPVEGLSLRATDPAGNTVSSVFVSDATNQGNFRIVLARGTEAFDLRISPLDTRPREDVFPALTLPSSSLLPDAQNHVRILVPSITTRIRYEGRVEQPPSRGIQPLAAARVHMRSSDVVDSATGLVGTVDIDTTTDSTGAFAAWVLPGTYLFEITPTSDDTLAVVTERHELRSTTGALRGQVLRVTERSVLGGTLRTGDGAEISGARVRADALSSPIATALVPELGRLNRSVETRSGSLGEFRLPLDVGMFDIVVEPPSGSGYAWFVEPALSVAAADGSIARSIRLEAPVAFRAVLVRADQSPVADADVSAFADSQGRRVEIARARTDSDGEFTLLLPPTWDTRAPR